MNVFQIESFDRNVRVELDPSNYVTKARSNKVIGVDASEFAKMTNLASLKLHVDELHIDNFKTI